MMAEDGLVSTQLQKKDKQFTVICEFLQSFDMMLPGVSEVINDLTIKL